MPRGRAARAIVCGGSVGVRISPFIVARPGMQARRMATRAPGMPRSGSARSGLVRSFCFRFEAAR
eukprot:3985761-Lingulodinium_polyedra.AAC.1